MSGGPPDFSILTAPPERTRHTRRPSVNLQSFVAGRRAEIEERGATAVEYALMVGLIAVGILGAVVALRDRISGTLQTVTDTLEQ
jgi:pilus assembly protein Flp/PilA